MTEVENVVDEVRSVFKEICKKYQIKDVDNCYWVTVKETNYYYVPVRASNSEEAEMKVDKLIDSMTEEKFREDYYYETNTEIDVDTFESQGHFVHNDSIIE